MATKTKPKSMDFTKAIAQTMQAKQQNTKKESGSEVNQSKPAPSKRDSIVEEKKVKKSEKKDFKPKMSKEIEKATNRNISLFKTDIAVMTRLKRSFEDAFFSKSLSDSDVIKIAIRLCPLDPQKMNSVYNEIKNQDGRRTRHKK